MVIVKNNTRVYQLFGLALGLLAVFGIFLGSFYAGHSSKNDSLHPRELIRFHVIANSDSVEDQALKYAVRDKILKLIAPSLAQSASLQDSRKIILGMEDTLLQVAEKVVREHGKDYQVAMDYGVFPFPEKSYGNIILPGGNYEAVKVKIGKAEGANWWCILFPPLCFVNIEESTTLPVDGKPGVPLQGTTISKPSYKEKKIGFFFERLLNGVK